MYQLDLLKPGGMLTMVTFITRHEKSTRLPVHRHGRAYVSLVLHGCYDEHSVDGRYALRTGSIVYHPPYHLHANTFERGSALVLNARLHVKQNIQYRIAYLPRLSSWFEQLMRRSASNLDEILMEILHGHAVQPEAMPNWVDELTGFLRDSADHQPIAGICRRLGVSPEHASREYRRNFGIGPQQFRREYRLRAACDALSAGTPASQAAQQAGFADQSHFGRVMKGAIGLTPAKYQGLL